MLDIMPGKRHKKTILLLTVGALLAVVVAVAVSLLLPESARGMRRCAVVVECEEWNEVSINGIPTLYFLSADADTALVRLTLHRDTATHRHWSAGCWVGEWPVIPSCHGRIATLEAHGGTPALRAKADVGALCRKAVEQKLAMLKGQSAELAYYLRVHGVQDEGYQQVAALARRVELDYTDCRRMREILDSVGAKARFTTAHRRSFTAIYRDTASHIRRTPCTLLASDAARRTLLLQTADGTTPSGAHAVMPLPWNCGGKGEIRMAGFGGLGVRGLECDTVGVSIVAGRRSADGIHDIPDILAPDGSAVFTARGLFIGLKSGDGMVPRADLWRLFGKEARR